MQVSETHHDGLKRGYVITLPAARLTGLRDARLAEIARGVPVAGYRRGEAPWAVIQQRFGASVLGEVLEQEVADAVRRLVADRALRPARPPAVEVAGYTEGSDLDIRVALEELPDVPLPDAAGIRLERQRAEPGEAQLRQALARLAMRHGTMEEVEPAPAARGDILVCDIAGGLPADLLANGIGLGALAGSPGRPPAGWSIDVTSGLEAEITATGLRDGLPCFDVRLCGTAGAGAFLRVFPAVPRGVPATAGQTLTLCLRARLIAGALPEGSAAHLGFNARSESGFLRSQRQGAALGAEEMRASVAMIDDPALAFARPLLEFTFRPGVAIDLTLRVGPARVFAGAEEPEALLFNGGTMTGQAIEVGGPAGLSAQLEGLAPGQARMVEAVLPADHAVSELANRRARYLVTARALRQRRPLAQDDALARAVGQADAAALEAAVMRSLRREYDARSRLRLKAALLDVLAAAADFPVPDCLLEAEFEQVWQRHQAERRAGRSDAADAGKDEAMLRAEYRAIAARRIRLRLMLTELARAHGVAVSEEEMARAIRQDAARYRGQERQVLDFYRANAEAQEALRAPLLEEKVVDLLIGRAEVSDRTVTPEELGGAP